MKRKLIALLMLGSIIAAACGGDDDVEAGGEVTEGGDAANFTVGIALAGPRNDRGFYQAHFEGVQQGADRLGFEFSVVDSLEDPQSRIDAFKNLAADNDLVIGGGAAFADAGNAVAEQFPDTTFVVTSGVTDAAIPNLHSYVVQQGAPAFLAGLAAVNLTVTKKIGFIGGAEIPPTFLSDQFFEASVTEQDPSADYVSTTIGTFNDAALAKEATNAQLAAGADVIFAFLDAGIPGVLQAIEESGKDVKVINPITNRCDESPQIAGFTFLNAQLLVNIILDDFVDGNLPDGTRFFALENPDIQDFQLCPEYQAPELVQAIDAMREAIVSGEKQLPTP